MLNTLHRLSPTVETLHSMLHRANISTGITKSSTAAVLKLHRIRNITTCPSHTSTINTTPSAIIHSLQTSTNCLKDGKSTGAVSGSYLRHSNMSLGSGRATICGGGSCNPTKNKTNNPNRIRTQTNPT